MTLKELLDVIDYEETIAISERGSNSDLYVGLKSLFDFEATESTGERIEPDRQVKVIWSVPDESYDTSYIRIILWEK